VADAAAPKGLGSRQESGDEAASAAGRLILRVVIARQLRQNKLAGT
jgi:hypothetical protein